MSELPGGPTGTVSEALARAAKLSRPIDGLRLIGRRGESDFRDWPTVHGRASRAAATLQALGVQSGDCVAIVLPTHLDFFDVFFGAMLLGAIPTPLYPPVRLGRLDEYYARTTTMLQAANAVTVVVDRRVGRIIGPVVERFRPRLGVVQIDTLQRDAAVTLPPPDPDMVAMVQFSSGTTVAPKPVALTHRQILANARAITTELFRAWPETDFEHTGVSWLPLYHDMGLIGCVLPALDRVRALSLIPPELFLSRPSVWLRTISEYSATISPAPDFAYALCAERIRDDELEGVDLSSWRAALNGAEPIAPTSLAAFDQRFRRWGLRPEALSPVYGLSEASLAVTFWPLDQTYRLVSFDRRALSQGRAIECNPDEADAVTLPSLGPALDGFAVQLRSPDGVRCKEAEEGRIYVSGPSLMKGYLTKVEQPITDGWLDTGDIGFWFEGTLFITGRARDVIVIRGQNHRPWEFERAVDGVSGVRVGCAAAVGDASGGREQLLVFVEARAPHDSLATECAREILRATGVEPGLVVVLEPGTLPRTSSGKIRRSETLKRWQRHELTPPNRVGPLLLAGALARSALSSWRHRIQPAEPGSDEGAQGSGG